MFNRTLAAFALAAPLFVLGCNATTAAIPVTEVPANVVAGFHKEYPGATIKSVEKETYKDGTIHYEFEFKDKDGKSHEVEFNTDGVALDKH